MSSLDRDAIKVERERAALLESLKSGALHAAFALGFQSVTGFALQHWLGAGAWVAGAAFAIGYFVSREASQHEHHLTAGGSLKGLAPWAGLAFWDWRRDGQIDAVMPVVAVVGVLAVRALLGA
jgi:ABC-type branched-subunit amino acid transport system permease subunit